MPCWSQEDLINKPHPQNDPLSNCLVDVIRREVDEETKCFRGFGDHRTTGTLAFSHVRLLKRNIKTSINKSVLVYEQAG